jgi:hypothetical protein
MSIHTPEARAKALESRKAKVEAGAHYKRDWLESGLWDSEAQKRGIRLPQWHRAPTPRLLKRWHESLEKEPFEAVYGCKPARLIALNPNMPLRAFIGQMLERVA